MNIGEDIPTGRRVRLTLTLPVHSPMTSPNAIHYIPIGTTALSIAFLAVIVRRAIPKHWPPHMAWWGLGVVTYGLGTALESLIAIGGNSALLTRLWFWAGAILGGCPLATGTVYLLCRRTLAHWLTALAVVVIIAGSILVFLSPIRPEALEAHRPGRHAILWMDWTSLKLLVIGINMYALIWFVGGAAYSSVYFFRKRTNRNRAIGTALIAVGGLLPAVGGTLAAKGVVEALYIGEFLGLILIWVGYEYCVRPSPPSPAGRSLPSAT